MGALMVPLPYLLRAPDRPRRRVRRGGRRSRSGRRTSTTAASRARTSTSRASRSRCSRSRSASSTARARHQPALIGALLALSFATKESTFITVFVAGTFFLVALAVAGAPPRAPRRAARAHGRRRSGGRRGRGRSPSFALVFTLLFTVFLTNPAGLWDGIYDGLAYWLAQHGPGRGEKEWYFYVVVLFAEEWPALLLGAVGAVAALRRPSLLRAVPDLGLRALARRLLVGERALQLAGAAPAAAAAAARRPRRAGDLGRAGALDRQARLRRSCSPARCYTGYTSWWANVENGADPREFLVTTQSAEEVKRRARRGRRPWPSAPDREGRDANILIDSRRGRDVPVGVVLPRPRRRLPRPDARGQLPGDTDVAILTEASRERLRGQLAGYDGRRFPFRVWWVRDYDEMSPAAGGTGSRSASRGTRPAGCRSGSTCARAPDAAQAAAGRSPDGRAVAVVDAPAEPVPLRHAGVAVVRPLERADDDPAHAVAVEQLARAPPSSATRTCVSTSAAPRRRRRGPTGARGPASRAPSAAR